MTARLPTPFDDGLGRRARRSRVRWSALGVHAVLLVYTFIALGPIVLVVANSMKSRRAIFSSPFALPNPDTFDLSGYRTVLDGAAFDVYFRNSLIVTVVSLLLVVAFSTMAAHALVEFDFRGNTALALYLTIGIMIPIRLGTVSLLKLMVSLNLVNTLWALIAVYTAISAHNVLTRLRLTINLSRLTVPKRIGIMIPIVRYSASAVLPRKSNSTSA